MIKAKHIWTISGVFGILMLSIMLVVLSSCGSELTEKPKEKKIVETGKEKREAKKTSFYNSEYIFVNGKQGKMEQRTHKGKLIGKLGSGKVCHVNEKWLYYVEQKNGMITMWRVPIVESESSRNKAVEMKKREELFSAKGKIDGRVCVEEPYIIFVIDGEKDELFQYNIEKKCKISCKFEIPVSEREDYFDIIEIALENGTSYVSVEEKGIFKQDLDRGETEAKCIYGGIYSCQILYVWADQLFFDHGNYTEPPLDAFCVKSYTEKSGVLWEVSAGNIEETMIKYFKDVGEDAIRDVKYNSVFGDFFLDEGKLYIVADDIRYKKNGKKKVIMPVLSYDPFVGEKSLNYEKELTEFLKGKRNSNIVDVVQQKVLVRENNRAYEFDLCSKKYKLLKKSDLNYWYVFGNQELYDEG